MDRRRKRSIRGLMSAAIVTAALALGVGWGCARRAGEIFPPPPRPIVWPAEPDAARIRWVGELRTNEDLRPAIGGMEGLGRAMFGKRAATSMLTPYAVCSDGSRVFVADSNAQCVQVFDLATRKFAQWRPTTDAKRFAQPVGIGWDPAARKLFVADAAAGRVYVFGANGEPLGDIGRDLVKRPCGIGIDSPNGRVFVADSAAHEVVVFSRDGALGARLGKRGEALGEFNYPTNVAVDSKGRFYVADSLNFRVQQFSPDLKPLRQIGQKGDLPGYFGQPKGVACDRDDHLYVVDAGFEAVQVFDPEGRLLLNFGQEGRGPGEFWLPSGIFIDPASRIWVADCYNRRVQAFDYLGEGPQ